MAHKQLSDEERYIIGFLRIKMKSIIHIANEFERHRSTIYRELKRNKRPSGYWGADAAIHYTRARRSRSRKIKKFNSKEWELVLEKLRLLWSPEQISGYFKKNGIISISPETIYRYIKSDKRKGGKLFKFLRHSKKKRRKKNNSKDNRGKLEGKKHISERPEEVEGRLTLGHWEIDTVYGNRSKHCLMTLVERRSGFAIIGKLRNRTKKELNRVTKKFLKKFSSWFKTITSDNGSEFHGYKDLERVGELEFYFANPYHSWERGTNENTNGLIRKYFPKKMDLIDVTQKDCDKIAKELNTRPRKRLGFKTPIEAFLN